MSCLNKTPAGYKHSELGEIPEDWEVKRLGEMGRFLKGRGIKKDEAQSGELPCVRYGEIYTHHSDYIKSFNSWISPQIAATATRLKQGDLLFAGSGETKEEIGKTVAFIDDCEAYAGGDIVILRAAKASPLFMGYYCNTAAIVEQKASKGQGDAVVHINAGSLSDIVLALPPLSEQRAIASVLADFDALLAALARLIDKKRDLKHAAMQQLLTGKTRLPGFSAPWKVKNFSDVLIRLNVKSHQIKTENYQKTGLFPVVDQGKQLVAGFSDRAEKLFQNPEGGVIVFGDHTCIVKFIDFNFLIGADGTQVLHGKHRQNTRFYAFQLQYRGVEPTGYNRHFNILKEMDFLVPPLPEQSAIAAVLADMDAELAALEVQREKIRLLKRAAMQQLLTGKIRLTPKEEDHD